MYAIPPTDLSNALTETLFIRYGYMTPGFDFIGSVLGACGALVVIPINYLPGGPVKPFLYIVQSPFWVLTLGECFPEMIHFFAGEATDCYMLFWPYG